jgi:hypothetical protein
MGTVTAPVLNDSSINSSRDIPLASNSFLFTVFLEEKIVFRENWDCRNVGQDQAQVGTCCIHFLCRRHNQVVVSLHANRQHLERVVAILAVALVHDFAKHLLAKNLLDDARLTFHLMETFLFAPCPLSRSVVRVAASRANHPMTTTTERTLVHFTKVGPAVAERTATLDILHPCLEKSRRCQILRD